MRIGYTSQEKTKNPSMDLYIYHNVLVQIVKKELTLKKKYALIVELSWMKKHLTNNTVRCFLMADTFHMESNLLQ